MFIEITVVWYRKSLTDKPCWWSAVLLDVKMWQCDTQSQIFPTKEHNNNKSRQSTDAPISAEISVSSTADLRACKRADCGVVCAASTESNSPNNLRLQRHGFHLTRWNNGTSVHNTPSPVFLMVTHILFKIICLIQSSKIRNYQYPYFILKFLCKIRYKFCSNLTSTGTRYIPLWFISTTQSGSWTWLLLVAKKRN